MLAIALWLLAPTSVAAMPDVLDTIFKMLLPGPFEIPLNAFTAPRVFRDPDDIALYTAAILCVIGLIIYLAPKGVRQPMHVTVDPQADPYQPAPNVSEYVRTTTEKLEVLGFSQQLDFTVPELPHEGFFRYMSLKNGSQAVLIFEVTVGSKGKKPSIGFKTVQFIEFQTILTGGIRINTNNNPLKNYFLPPPGIFVKSASHLVEPRDLSDEHRRHVEEVRTHGRNEVIPQRLEEFISRFPQEWERIHEYQAAVGLVRRDLSNQQFIGTPKIIVKAIFSGFTEDFGGLTGLAIPVMVSVFMGALVWSMPILLAVTGLYQKPILASEIEICGIGLLGLTAGLASRMAGGIWGGFCYAPAAVLFVAGPVGIVAPLVMAIASGGLGEKLAFVPMWKSWRDLKLLSPEIYIALLALLLAAFSQ